MQYIVSNNIHHSYITTSSVGDSCIVKQDAMLLMVFAVSCNKLVPRKYYGPIF